jgi:hypothetical protein
VEILRQAQNERNEGLRMTRGSVGIGLKARPYVVNPKSELPNPEQTQSNK